MKNIGKYIGAVIVFSFVILGLWTCALDVYTNNFFVGESSEEVERVHGNAGIQHIGFIMDGNRRWAKANHLKPWIGHEGGVNPVKEAVRFCCAHEIPMLSLYAFSLENFNRSNEELEHLFDVVEHGLSSDDIANLAENGVSIRFIGDRDRFPQRLLEVIDTIETATQKGTALRVNILFCYGGRQEICSAVKKIAKKVVQGALDPEQLDESIISSLLWLKDCPEPDLIVRTGGEKRLSNFMAWQSCYSELMFLDTFWPAMTRADFELVLVKYAKRKRRFGC